MARAPGKSEDYLGLVALGSVIGNFVQAAGYRKLKGMYDHVLERYRMLQREYAALRSLNDQLQQQVVDLRKENNHLLAQLAEKPQGIKI
jgi:uncharacterized membrane protein